MQPFPLTSANLPQMPSLSGVRTLVVGLGRFGGGVGVTLWLVRQGAHVTVTDQADASTLTESLEAISGLPVTLRLGADYGFDSSKIDLAVINPAVLKSTSALFQKICHENIPWTTEINLFCERCPARVLAITGSFGKSTTCAMLAHALERILPQASNHTGRVHLGGNIGKSLLLELPEITSADTVVLELSNAQLEDIDRIQWKPSLAVMTNLFPHHLDRYDNFEGYIQAKLNLVRAGDASCPVVAGELDPLAFRLLMQALGSPARLTRVSRTLSPIPLAVPGEHNQTNAAFVRTACGVMGFGDSAVCEALESFRGLSHRLEVVGVFGGVTYINDSKSTAPPATMIAVDALRERAGRLIVIVGGQKKDVPLEDCAGALKSHARIVICCGEAGPRFAAALKEAGKGSSIVHVVAGVEEAVEVSRREARDGDTVLFSPGAPSFDHYTNFTKRGEHFAQIARNF